MIRTVRRSALVLVVATMLVLLAAGPAFADASLESTSPAPGAVLTETPPAIVLKFTEAVTVSFGGIRLFDENGERIATQAPTKPDSSTVSAGVAGRLADGSYVVTWRVNSADSHPIQGAFTFQIGTAGNATGRDVTGLADKLLADQKGTRVVGAAWGEERGGWRSSGLRCSWAAWPFASRSGRVPARSPADAPHRVRGVGSSRCRDRRRVHAPRPVRVGARAESRC